MRAILNGDLAEDWCLYDAAPFVWRGPPELDFGGVVGAMGDAVLGGELQMKGLRLWRGECRELSGEREGLVEVIGLGLAE
ncbi:MAG: hypothetical protein ABSG69_10670 [Candidatus Acidiferrum sp.]